MEKSIIYTHAVGKVLPMRLSYWPRWSLGVRTANFIFTSGQPGVDDKGKVLGPGDIREQTRGALLNLQRIVEGGGGKFSEVVRIRAFLGFAEDRQGMVEAFNDFLDQHFDRAERPSGTIVVSPVGAARSADLLLAEIECFAATERRVLRGSGHGSQQAVEKEVFAPAVQAGNLLFLSGLSAPEAGQEGGAAVKAQATVVLDQMKGELEAAGFSVRDLVKVTVYFADSAYYKPFCSIYNRFLQDHGVSSDFPARSALVLPLVEPGASLKVEAIAACGKREALALPGLSYTDTEDLSGSMLGSSAVTVSLSSASGSYLQRFALPSYDEGWKPHQYHAFSRESPLGRLMFLSSMGPYDHLGKVIEGEDEKAQTKRVFWNLNAVLEAGGGRLRDLAQVDIFLGRREDYPGFNEARIQAAEEFYPDKDFFCGSGVLAEPVVENVRIEIEGIAALPEPRRPLTE